MNRALLFLLVSLVASPAAAATQDKGPPRPPSGAALDPQVDALVRAEVEKRHTPGLSLAVVRNGKVVLAKGYGFANLEHEAPATPTTVYQLASVTKQFTAAAVQLLIAQG